MSQVANRVQWTVHDLELLPQNEGISHEIIAGDLFVTRSPHRKHQQVTGRIFSELDAWSQRSGQGEAILFPGVIFSTTDAVIPDLVWLSQQRLSITEDAAGHLTAAPELIVEVLSSGQSNIQRDREVKLKLYSVYGVQEYWIVDRFSQQVEIYRRDQAQLGLSQTLRPGDLLISPLLPEFSCSIDRFFP